MPTARMWCSFSVIAVVLGLASTATAAPITAKKPPIRQWTWLYVMSYDNNLDGCTEQITNGLRAGIQTDQVAVAILSDRPDSAGLHRLGFSKTTRAASRLTTDDITDPKVITDFFAWATATFPARHYAVVFLDHGGRLDQMCADEHAGPRGDQTGWLSARAMAAALTKWSSTRTVGRVELLFLQQCGRGSIENLYQFRGSAAYLMASQTNVGACNTYYANAVSLSGATSTANAVDGAALAKRIMAADRHYTSYVLVRGSALQTAPKLLGAVANELLAVPKKRFVRPPHSAIRPCFGDPRGEVNYDMIAYLRALYAVNHLPQTAAMLALSKWQTDQLIVSHQFRNVAQGTALKNSWFGISMHVPRSTRALAPYSRLPLYQSSAWHRLADRLATAERPAAAAK